jgi:RimJ/RimL family protein N-acetyltransferase
MPATPQEATAFEPVLLDIPHEFRTGRLLIRAPRTGDGALVHASVMETLDELRAYPSSLPWALAEQTPAAQEAWARRGAASWLLRSDFPLIVLDGGTGEHVGNAGIHRFDWEKRVFEIGWWGRRRHHGRGLMTEAVRAVIDYAFTHLGARRVWAMADERNERSWKLAERVGLLYEGTLRGERGDPDGTRCDMRVYALTR